MIHPPPPRRPAVPLPRVAGLTRAGLVALALCAGGGAAAAQEAAQKAGQNAGQDVTAERPADDQTLTAWMRDAIRTMDPQKSADPVSDQAIRLVFEGLYRPGPDGRPLPAVATGHSVSADRLTWTFRLRDDARWSDGAPLVADDFVAALRRLADPAFGSDGAWFVQLMGLVNADAVVRGAAAPTDLGARAVDDRTLELRLSAPAPWLDKAMMRVWTFPVPRARVQAAAVDGADWTDVDRLVGNGPFILTGRDSDKRATFAPDPAWYGAADRRLDAVTMLTGGPPAEALAKFDAGDIDILSVPGPLFGAWSAGRANAAVAVPRGCTNALIVNLGETAPEALTSPDIRRALSLAIDRDALVTQVVTGGQTPAWGWVPPTLAGFAAPANPDATLSAADRAAEAARILSDAGFTADAPLRLTLRYNTSEDHERIAAALRAAWQPLNVELRLVHDDWAGHAAQMKSGEFHLARMGWCADVNDASGFLRYFRDNGPNPGRYGAPDFTSAAAAAAADPGDGADQTRAAAMLQRDLPMIPLYHYAAPMLIAPDLRGVARGDAMGGWSGQDIWRAAP